MAKKSDRAVPSGLSGASRTRVGREIIAAQKAKRVAQIVDKQGNRIAGPVQRVTAKNGAPAPAKLEVRYFRIYIGTDDAYDAFRLYFAIQAYLRMLGAESYSPVSVAPGSVFIKLKAWSRKWAQNREVRKLALELRMGLEEAFIDKTRTENDERRLNAAAAFLNAAKDIDSVSVDLDSIKLAKYIDANGKTHANVVGISASEAATHRLSDEIVQNPETMVQVMSNPNNPEITSGGN